MKFQKRSPDPYSVYAAQAAEVVVSAISRSNGTRASMTSKLFGTTVTNGILGTFMIDKNGDTTLKGITIYAITGSGNAAKGNPVAAIFPSADLGEVTRPSRTRCTRRGEDRKVLPPPSLGPLSAQARSEPLPRRRFSFGVAPAAGLVFVGLLLFLLIENAVRTPADFFQNFLTGITNGAVYALIALGYSLVYGILELINFAHGDVFMMGGMFASSMVLQVFVLSSGPSMGTLIPAILASLVVGMVACGLMNATIERIAYKPLRGAPRLAPLITAIGASFVVQNIGLALDVTGPTLSERRVRPAAQTLPTGTMFTIGGVKFRWRELIVDGRSSCPWLIGLVWLVQYSRQGKAMEGRRAGPGGGGDDGHQRRPDDLVHVPDRRRPSPAPQASSTSSTTQNTAVRPRASQLGLIAFTSAVLGGIGNLPGAVLGALLHRVDPGVQRRPQLAYAGKHVDAVDRVLRILILILVFRPEGLLGEQTPEGQ